MKRPLLELPFNDTFGVDYLPVEVSSSLKGSLSNPTSAPMCTVVAGEVIFSGNKDHVIGMH